MVGGFVVPRGPAGPAPALEEAQDHLRLQHVGPIPRQGALGFHCQGVQRDGRNALAHLPARYEEARAHGLFRGARLAETGRVLGAS